MDIHLNSFNKSSTTRAKARTLQAYGSGNGEHP